MFFYWIVPNSRSFSIVVVEQTTESLQPGYRAICSVIVGRLDQRTVRRRTLNALTSGKISADRVSALYGSGSTTNRGFRPTVL